MSWQDYVDNFLINHTNPNTGKSAYTICQYGAIVGNQDGTIWASTPGFTFEKYSTEIDDDQGNPGLGIGDWGLGPIPNPQSPIPNPLT
jgi:hypothetical protein